MAEEDGFEAFYRLQFERVARTVYALLESREDALDVAQESFVRTWERWDQLSRRDEPVFFTLRVAINLANSRLRRLIRFRRILPLLGRGESREEMFGEIEFRSELRQMLGDLSRKQKLAVVLCDVLDLADERAARVMGIAPPTLRVHLARGREKLRAVLKAPDPERVGNEGTIGRRWIQ